MRQLASLTPLVSSNDYDFGGDPDFCRRQEVLHHGVVGTRDRGWPCRELGSITDRKGFYHQAAVTPSRAQSNATPFSFDLEELSGFRALQIWEEEQGMALRRSRETAGDQRLLPAQRPSALYPSFGALYQGDHHGVEYALDGHQQLLSYSGLLVPEQRMQNGELFPLGRVWEGLIIDDYFIISAQPGHAPKEKSEAYRYLEKARKAYALHSLPGSPEKDVVAEEFFKAAGAEIDSSLPTRQQSLVGHLRRGWQCQC